MLLAGVPGTPKANVVILGGGTVGTNACKIAVGMGANVTIIDISLPRLEYLDDRFGSQIQTLLSTDANIERAVKEADLGIGSVLIPGASTPKLFKKKYLKEMKPGAVFVDVAIDQGGCGESSRVTSHDDPIFIEDGIVHYCVGNMPGAVPRTSTIALTNATIRYGLQIANLGLEEACRKKACRLQTWAWRRPAGRIRSFIPPSTPMTERSPSPAWRSAIRRWNMRISGS